ncbi:hypothetical protein DYB37_010328 [Aphanomyces astaci]|uniref:Uncharacterized protein n=1 Tax=Aphanomyces astaci TaxID=112090 RepID=A0A3R6XEQ8_APHAT|nr:hypothetical protein DYB37_010328 [Aphanomyces astaci]
MALSSWLARRFGISLSPMVVLAIFCTCEYFQSAFLLSYPAVDAHFRTMYKQTVANVRLMHLNVTPSFRAIFLAPHQGLVEPVDDIVGTTDAKMLLLNGSSLWCAGWVRLNDDYFVRVEAIPALVVNLVCHTTFFLVCGAKV